MTRTSKKSVIGLLILAASIAACGQKGPLFLPGDAAQVETVAPIEERADESEEEQDAGPATESR